MKDTKNVAVISDCVDDEELLNVMLNSVVLKVSLVSRQLKLSQNDYERDCEINVNARDIPIVAVSPAVHLEIPTKHVTRVCIIKV